MFYTACSSQVIWLFTIHNFSGGCQMKQFKDLVSGLAIFLAVGLVGLWVVWPKAEFGPGAAA